MSAAALFLPGSGSYHTPHSERLNALPPGLRVAASETWHAILNILRRGQTETDERVTDRVLAQHMGRSRRFVQKGLKALQDLGMITRRREHGRRTIVIKERLRGRDKPPAQPAAGSKSRPAPTKASASIPNVGIVPPATPEQVATAQARIAAVHAELPELPEPTPEEKAAVDRFMEESRRRREAAERARERPRPVTTPRPNDPNAPGMAAQAVLEARRKAMGIRVAPDPEPLPGTPPPPAEP